MALVWRVLAAAVAAMSVMAAVPLHAQTPDEYLQLKDRYVGAPETAAAAVALWDAPAIRRGVERCLRVIDAPNHRTVCSPQERLAVAMMHTDAAIMLTRSPEVAILHVEIAARVLEGLTARNAALKPFVTRWYEFATMLYLSRGLARDAERLANEAVRRYPGEARPYAARGAVNEMKVLARYGNIFGEWPMQDVARQAVARNLTDASVDYTRALDLDPSLTFIRVRRGLVQVLLGDGRAGSELRAAADTTEDAGTRYLAHLFLGALASRDGRPDEALEAYENARFEGPGFQTACLALSHAQAVAGRTAAARSTALDCATRRNSSSDDPWWLLRRGIGDPGVLVWLRREARRQ